MLGTLDEVDSEMDALWSDCGGGSNFSSKAGMFREGIETVNKKNSKANELRKATDKVKSKIPPPPSKPVVNIPQFPNDGNLYKINDGNYDWFIQNNKIIGKKPNRQHYREK
jgi:hypothetical protein